MIVVTVYTSSAGGHGVRPLAKLKENAYTVGGGGGCLVMLTIVRMEGNH